jgi:Flp pilus assembly protein TadD
VGSASDFVRDARKRFPDDVTLVVLEGLVYYCQGNLPEAEKRLREAHARDGRNEIASVNLASVLVDAGRVDEAATIAREVQTATNNEAVRARAARVLEFSGSER